MILSVLVPSTTVRARRELPKLLGELEPQLARVPRQVELIVYVDNFARSTGHKRNALLDLAQGQYASFVDDDDSVDSSYVRHLLECCASGADCVCFKVEVSVTGGSSGYAIYDKNFARDENLTRPLEGNVLYKRLPNHIMCVKTALARRARFPDISHAEDISYAERLKPLLGTQCSINRVLYHYHADYTKTGEGR